MSTIYVWVLLIGTHTSLAVMIDNISTEQECLRIQQIMRADGVRYTRCIQVEKIK